MRRSGNADYFARLEVWCFGLGPRREDRRSHSLSVLLYRREHSRRKIRAIKLTSAAGVVPIASPFWDDFNWRGRTDLS